MNWKLKKYIGGLFFFFFNPSLIYSGHSLRVVFVSKGE